MNTPQSIEHADNSRPEIKQTPIKNKGGSENQWLKAAKAPDVTPMMAQFMTIKSDYSDCLLFYRMGDFYELFFSDAETAASALDITLTKRGKHAGDEIPMCGVPVHAAEMYLSRLIRKGYKVAVCEQTEDPAEAKKRGYKAVVKREVVRLVTPGTITEDNLLDARSHNYLVTLGRAKNMLSLGVADMSTGEFYILPTKETRLDADLARLSPSELLISENLIDDPAINQAIFDFRSLITPLDGKHFDSSYGERRLKDLYGVATLDGMANFTKADLAAAGALLFYIEDTQKGKMPNLNPPVRQSGEGTMMIDAATRRSLELTRTQSGEAKGSLLSTIDCTVTGAGARLLKLRLSAPLTDPVRINDRLDSVQYMLENIHVRGDISAALKSAPDMDRALSRIAIGRAGPRDLAAIRNGLETAYTVQRALKPPKGAFDTVPDLIKAAAEDLGPHISLINDLTRAITPEPPMIIRDGNFIAHGYHATLDEFRTLRDESRRLIAGLEADYKTETNINSLKIKHNNVLGYHIDMSARHADALMAPPLNERFIHRQTLANNVRFSTTELSKLAGKISEAGDRALALELEIFETLIAHVLSHAEAISFAASALAELDFTSSLARLAEHANLVRPEIDDTLTFNVVGGRHLVVEQALKDSDSGAFVANDCIMQNEDRLWLITGPNMAGKSTYLRQNALMAVLAQMGGYVPATSAHIGVVDRLFSRVGASDDLAHGRSTFMVEMVETAAILNQAGPRSLVILDEIGRGTATYDGLSIAWAAVENLHNINQSRALFATHYHELTALKESLDSLSLHAMKVKEWKGDVVFLHEVRNGAADRSYGIQVAKLAGLPGRVIARARQVLNHLEASDKGDKVRGLVDDLPLFHTLPEKGQSNISHNTEPIYPRLIERMDTLNPDELSPRDALDILYALRDDFRADKGDQ